jgi:hypothetical protein
MVEEDLLVKKRRSVFFLAGGVDGRIVGALKRRSPESFIRIPLGNA